MNIQKMTLVNEAIANFLQDNQGNEVYTSLCSCGAITMSCYGCNTGEISFLKENAPFISPTNTIEMCNCNHCCNGWGVDSEDDEESEDF